MSEEKSTVVDFVKFAAKKGKKIHVCPRCGRPVNTKGWAPIYNAWSCNPWTGQHTPATIAPPPPPDYTPPWGA